MAWTGNNTTIALVEPGAWLPRGEFGVLVCLLTVPLLWTVLIGAMVCNSIETFRLVVVLAIAVGLGADSARLVWLHRQATR